MRIIVLSLILFCCGTCKGKAQSGLLIEESFRILCFRLNVAEGFLQLFRKISRYQFTGGSAKQCHIDDMIS